MDNKLILYGSIGMNVLVLFVLAAIYFGGWLFVTITWAILMTALSGFLLYRSIEATNGYQDVIEDIIEDTEFFIQKLEPFLSSDIYLSYSDEVKGLILGIKAFRNRLQQWVDAYETDGEIREPIPVDELRQQRPMPQYQPTESAFKNAGVFGLPPKRLFDAVPKTNDF